jgi:N-acetylmuramoyl-L-alanine amidase
MPSRLPAIIASVLAAVAVTACRASTSAGPIAAPASPHRAGIVQQAPQAPSGAPSPSPSPTARSRLLTGEIITIDPGHNGGNAAHPEIVNRLVNAVTEMKPCDTTGTETNAGYPESAFTFDVAIRLAALLRAQGATVVLTRQTNTGVGPCITERAAIGNRAHSNAAISIHADGGPASGHGFHVIEPVDVHGPSTAILKPSARLAVDVRDAYQRITGLPPANYIGSDGIDPRSDMGGLNLSTVPKVMVECGNMRNAGDARLLSSPAFRQRIAAALAAALARFLLT